MDLVITATRCESSDDCPTDYYCESTGCVFTYTCPVRKHEVLSSSTKNWDIDISVAATAIRVAGCSELVASMLLSTLLGIAFDTTGRIAMKSHAGGETLVRAHVYTHICPVLLLLVASVVDA